MKPNNTKTFHAWYSPRAARLYGSIIYARPDGTEVEVTIVYDSNVSNDGWTDKIYVGEVARYLRKGQIGEFERRPLSPKRTNRRIRTRFFQK